MKLKAILVALAVGLGVMVAVPATANASGLAPRPPVLRVIPHLYKVELLRGHTVVAQSNPFHTSQQAQAAKAAIDAQHLIGITTVVVGK